MIKLLIVDDSALARKLLAEVFGAQSDFDIRLARDGKEALATLDTWQPDVITLDINMPAMDGLTCLDRIMVEHPCPVVMVSSLTADGADATLEALHLGAVDFIAKPRGAMSLGVHDIAAAMVEKVRCAVGAKPRNSLRLRERVRHRLGQSARRSAAKNAVAGDGLVLVGTSTGGPPALEALLSALPAAFPWPVLVAQHMPAASPDRWRHDWTGCAR